MNIKLYSTHCGHCQTIALLLKKKNLSYEEIYVDPTKPEEVQIIANLGLNSAPALVVDGKVMDYRTAFDWLRGQ